MVDINDLNFNKLVVCYSTNRDTKFKLKYEKEIIKSSGLSKKKNEIYVIACHNDGDLSLTQAYNQMLNTAKQEYENFLIVFIHHDIHFKTQGWGKNLINIFNKNEVDILGLAGTDILFSHCVWWLDQDKMMNQNNLWGKVWHTDGKKQWVSNFTGNKKCDKIQYVAAIDGVFIACNPITCVDFDEDITGFHLYDISFCIENYLHGRKIAVTQTIQILHDSGGQLSMEWEANRAKLEFIYKHNLPIIN